MQSRTVTVEIGGRNYTARQLTLGEMIESLETPPQYIAGMEVLDVLLLEEEGMTLSDVLQFSDATEDDLKAMTEAEVIALAGAVKGANQRFFSQVRPRLVQLGQAAIQQQGEQPPQTN